MQNSSIQEHLNTQPKKSKFHYVILICALTPNITIESTNIQNTVYTCQNENLKYFKPIKTI